MTRRSSSDADRSARRRATKRVATWLREIMRDLDMRQKASQAFVRRAREIAASLGVDPTQAQLDVIKRYCFTMWEADRLEAAAFRGANVDVTALLRLSERLLQQAKALGGLPVVEPPSKEELSLARSFAEAHANMLLRTPGSNAPPPSQPVPQPVLALPPPDLFTDDPLPEGGNDTT